MLWGSESWFCIKFNSIKACITASELIKISLGDSSPIDGGFTLGHAIRSTSIFLLANGEEINSTFFVLVILRESQLV